MFITSVLLLLASILPLQNREDIDQARFVAYDYLDQGHLDSAILMMDKAISAAEKMNYQYGSAKSIFVKSYLYRIDNQLGKSFELNLGALRILESSDDARTPETLAQIYGNTGEILINHFKYQEAIKYFNQGLDVAIEHNLEERTQNLLYNRGFALRKASVFNEAMNDFMTSLSIADELGDEWMFLNSHNMLGNVAIDLGKYDDARAHFGKILDHTFKEELRDEYIGIAYSNIGKTYYLEGKMPEASDAYLSALRHLSLIDDSSELFQTQLELTAVHITKEDFTQAWYYGNLAASNYNHTILSPDNYRIFDLLTTVAFEQNQFKTAQEFHQRYIQENEAFILAQKETLQLSEQYKMELLTASFFKDIEKQEQMAQLNQIIYFLLGLGLLSLVFVRAKKYLFKKSLEQAFREVTQKRNFRF